MSARHIAFIQTGRDSWLRFADPRRIVSARSLDGVAPAIAAVEAETAAGGFAVGLIAYEAAGAFDPALHTHVDADVPLVWFGIYPPPESLAALPPEASDSTVGTWQPSVSRADYTAAIARIRDYLEAGDTYQVNYTMRLRSRFDGDPYSLFAALSRAQRSTCCAYIDIGSHAICSASPELFFELDGRVVRSRPMKGTAARGLTWAEDEARAAALRASRKDQAENVMIVDMIRNDLGRVAIPGSVRVTRLYDVERFPTVLQMTSTVEAETDASFSTLIGALFPCSSITGAPKARTMEIIRELEPDPRGVYTGAVGYVAPGRKARFNVAIRTVVVRRDTGTAEYGVGGGITWDSTDADEYAECLKKAAVLTHPMPEFDLLETLRWTPEAGYALLERHLQRLERSAAYFQFDVSLDEIRRCLADAATAFAPDPHRVRLTVDRSGSPRAASSPLGEARTRPLRVALASAPVDEGDCFLYHKTTNRSVYEAAKQSRPDCDDVILLNTAGHVTESTIANVVVETGGVRLTPAVRCGLLSGTFREELLEQGLIREAVLTADDLRKAERLYLVNSVRDWMPAELVL